MPNSTRDLRLNSARLSFSSSETSSLWQESETLKRLLKEAQKELSSLQSNHALEVKSLQESIFTMRKEVNELKQEKQETMALQSYGIDEYGQLAQEVIRLRTEVDRLRYLYDKEKRKALN
jgi:HAMP domain-containing protein